MSCPDWRRLDPADREAAEADGWEAALRHLDTGCPRCWQEAVALDPTLIFRRLPALELGPAQEAEEVEAARLAVTAMRTASRVGRRGSHAPSRLHTARSVRAALAASLTAMALVYGSSSHGWHAPAVHPTPSNPAVPGTRGTLGTPATPVIIGAQGMPAGTSPIFATGAAGAAMDTLPASTRSSIEGLSRPRGSRARVYQLDGPHMSVVMIVDDKLDV